MKTFGSLPYARRWSENNANGPVTVICQGVVYNYNPDTNKFEFVKINWKVRG